MRELENPPMLDFLRARAPSAELTMSVCSGSAILARAGLLDGRRATSNKQFFELARGQSNRVEWVEAARWVEDGPFATSSGVSAGTDMALGVIARLYGRETAQRVADLTEYQWHSDSSRDPFHRFLNQGRAEDYLAAKRD
jgi:transcriptional regulator GlxA family with amidase domain